MFEQKVAWVTGASSGIGEQLAYALARKGASVVLSSRREQELERVRSACDHSDRHHIVPLDLGDSSSIVSAVEQVRNQFSHVDLLINNAGLSQRGLAMDTELSVVRRIMEVNFFGTVALTKAVLPNMLDRGTGHVAVVSSLLGKFGVSNRSAYAASKHALHGFFDSLRLELHDSGIHITLACPGFVQTNASMNALTGDGTPQGKMDEDLLGGMDAQDCAEKILRAIQHCRQEVYLGRNERLAAYLNRMSPRLFQRILRNRQLK